MRNLGRALLAAAGVFALSAGALAAGKLAPIPSNLTSFGFAGGASSSPFAASAFGAPSFATSAAVSPNLALDFGQNIDVVSRFNSLDAAAADGVFDNISVATAANPASGGIYSGLTWMGNSGYDFRAGFLSRTTGSDPLSYGSSYLATGRVPGSSNALMGAFNVNFTDWVGANVTAVAARDQSPLLGSSSNKAVGISAYLGLGEGWIGTVTYSQNQLDLKPISETAQNLSTSSYGLGIAKRGLFGDDTLGVSLLRPDPGQGTAADINNMASGTIPGLAVHRNMLDKPADADIELGYVTTFLSGTVALQANASYQMNFNNKPDSVSLLSRAKIKF